MNLNQLHYFSKLADAEHYTKAAELLSITQPSLSHAISSLENELGVKLFEKEGRNVVLTKCGRAFLEDVEQSLSILDSSVNKLQMTGSGEGQIDIAVLRTLSTQLVPGLVRNYIKEHPKQNIDFRFHNSTGLRPWRALCPPASASPWCPTWLSSPTCRSRSSASPIPPGSGFSTCAA